MAKKKGPIPCQRPELLGLLQACKEKPEDDGPRLILADWLDDHSRGPADEARVRAIRAGVEAGRLPEGDERRRSLEDEARKLFVTHENEWLGPLVPFCGRWYSAIERGMLHVTARGGEILTKAGAEAARSEEYAWVDSLRIGRFSSEAGEKLLASGLLPSLNALSLADTDFDWRGIKALALSPQLANLRELNLSQTRTGIHLGPLVHSPHLGNLRSLNLDSTGAGASGTIDLAGTKKLPALRELVLSRNNMELHDLTPLLRTKALKGLTRLNLFQNVLRDEGLAMLAANPAFSTLEDLDVSCNAIGDAGAIALAGVKWKGLKRLDLHSNLIGEAGALALAASPALENIEILDLSKNKAGRRGNAALRERFGERVKA
jgi:uncharacterized protein (TIGR02996 family)